MLRSVLCSIAVSLIPPALAAQEPITVAAPSQRTPGIVSLTNRSGKSILGYVVSFHSNGTTVNDTRLRGLGTKPVYDAGEVWPHKLSTTSPEHPPAVKLEFVLFQDGTTWGKSAGHGERLKGVRDGWKAARTYYRRVLTEEGVQALRAALAGDE